MRKTKYNNTGKLTFTKTKARGRTRKAELVDRVRQSLDEYATVYVFSLRNSRTSAMKELRAELRDSRFMIGKNKVIQVALGRTHEQAYLPGADEFAKHLVGNVGLFFTNEPNKAVEKRLTSFSEMDYARAGMRAPRQVKLLAGPLVDQPSSMLEQLRKMKLPVVLNKGVIEMERDHVICEAGDVLTPEQSAALKAFGVKLSEFRVRLLWRWIPKKGSKGLTKLGRDDDDDGQQEEADMVVRGGAMEGVIAGGIPAERQSEVATKTKKQKKTTKKEKASVEEDDEVEREEEKGTTVATMATAVKATTKKIKQVKKIKGKKASDAAEEMEVDE